MINIKEIFIFSFDALKGRKIRSILTILMVMVGSSLLIAVGSMGAGFTHFFNKQFENLAPNVLFINSAQTEIQAGGVGGGPPPAPKITLNTAVINRLSSLPFVNEVIPSYQGQITLISQGDSKEVTVFSMDPSKLPLISPTTKYQEGSSIRPNDPSAMIVPEDIAFPPGEETPFLTLGQSLRAEYSFVDPITGKEDKETKSFVVSAIAESTGNPTVDNAVIFNAITGNSLLQKSNKYDALIVIAESSDFVPVVEEEIRSLYGNNIGITTVAAILETIQEFTAGINSFLTSIAVISLVVGAVGIITTLYTSVVERIREIGTMKAIGAKNMDILSLFMVESLLIGMIGATLGLCVGIVGGYVLTIGFSDPNQPLEPVFLPADMVRVWIISVALSILAGLLPSFKASKTLPIEALRPQ